MKSTEIKNFSLGSYFWDEKDAGENSCLVSPKLSRNSSDLLVEIETGLEKKAQFFLVGLDRNGCYADCRGWFNSDSYLSLASDVENFYIAVRYEDESEISLNNAPICTISSIDEDRQTKINFGVDGNPAAPTIVLATKSGKKLGVLPAVGIKFKTAMNSCSEFSFSIYEKNISSLDFWNEITDFKLIWAKEWNLWFEISVETDEAGYVIKHISAKSLGESELSQVNLYDVEINTETDIAREGYKVTTLYNADDPEASLLNRITEKAPNYTISHVDNSIVNIQRAFTFNNKSIYDSFQEIAKEIECVFVLTCSSNANGEILRNISVYDLKNYCLDCGERGDFEHECNKCGGTNIKAGYGKDTSIFVSIENLAENIQYKTDVGSVKNCFKLIAGDDLMTATIANCNPNGSDYIWYISDAMKKDMSAELVSKLHDYDITYNRFETSYESIIDENLISDYNDLIEKYSTYSSDYKKISIPIKGYSAIMQAYYDTIDFKLFLTSGLMPTVNMQKTNAQKEIQKIDSGTLSPVAIKDLSQISLATADSAVLSVAKILVDSRYQVKIKESSLDKDNIWVGKFTIINYSDENDTATSEDIPCMINNEYERYVRQKIDKALHKKTAGEDNPTNVSDLFKLDRSQFLAELKKYCLGRLNSFRDCCQTCIDVMIEQGVADKLTWADRDPNLYDTLYASYMQKLNLLEAEIKIRESEIAVISGENVKDNSFASQGIQNILSDEKDYIRDKLSFSEFLGEELWKEFSTYRREDSYSNQNYISDGLNNADLFKTALEFIETARREILKSATSQHTITATLKNLLVMKEFSSIVDYFEVGNWIRIRVDDNLYKLRLIGYEIDFDNLENLNVTFSDVTFALDGISDVESILKQASNMATTYDTVSRQSQKGKQGKLQLDNWVNNGLALTKMKIVDSADSQNITWDEHGLLCREYSDITNDYDDKQLKVINRGLYLTDDNWQSSRAGIGDFEYYNPKTEQTEESYGVIANTLIGNLILSKEVGIYNTKNSITLDENGFVITADNTADGQNQMTMSIRRKETNSAGEEILTDVMYLDNYGNLVLNGSIKINTSSEDGLSTIDELTSPYRYTNEISQRIHNAIYGRNGVYKTLDERILDQKNYTNYILNNYKAEIGQYLSFGEDGLVLGSMQSGFKTVMDNQRLAFMDGDTTAAYISNNQLYIPNAVVQQTMTFGNFTFAPRDDGGMSLTWNKD